MLRNTKKILLILISNLIVVFLIACSFTSQETTLGSVRLSAPLDRAQLHKQVYISEGFSSSEENNISDALKNWECITGGLISFDIHFKYPQDSTFILQDGIDKHTILLILPAKESNKHIIDTDDYVKNHDNGRYVIGLYYETDDVPTILLVNDRIGYWDYKPVVEHEVGHALMLDHLKDRNSVMFPHIDESAKMITKVDLTALCNIYWCSAEEMSKNIEKCESK